MNLAPNWTRHTITLLSICAAMMLTGCIAVVAGAAAAGTVAYVRGDLHAALEGKTDAVLRATGSAIDKLRFVKLSENKDALVGIFEARTAEERKVHIKVSRVTDNLTNVEIRVGLFGNEALSRTILDRIKAEL